MAKYLRVGEVCKGKVDEKTGKPKGDYIKITEDVVLKKGTFLNLETPADAIKNIQKALANGKMKEETAEKMISNLEKAPWVRFRITMKSDD